MSDQTLPLDVRDHVLTVLRATAGDIRDFAPDDDFHILVMGGAPETASVFLGYQQYIAAEGEQDVPAGRTFDVPVIGPVDWNTLAHGAIRLIVNDLVIPWLAQHAVIDEVEPLEDEDPSPWTSPTVTRSSWTSLPEDS